MLLRGLEAGVYSTSLLAVTTRCLPNVRQIEVDRAHDVEQSDDLRSCSAGVVHGECPRAARAGEGSGCARSRGPTVRYAAAAISWRKVPRRTESS